MSRESSSSWDWVTLPCGWRVPDMTSARTLENLKSFKDHGGISALQEIGGMARFEMKEHENHAPGTCSKTPEDS